MAMAHDQPDNGWRLRSLGVGDYLYPWQFKPERVVQVLERLTSDATTAGACAHVKDRMRNQMGPERVAELLEGLAEKRRTSAR